MSNAATTIQYKEFAPFLDGMQVSYRVADDWLISGKPVSADGWILFVSCIGVDVPKLLDAVIPELLSKGVAFRVIMDQRTHAELNTDSKGVENLGKVLSVYPQNIDELKSLIAVLLTKTEGVRGPILDDCVQVGKTLFAGYTGGLKKDGSAVSLSIPDEKDIPFTIPVQYPLNRKLKRLLAWRYVIKDMLAETSNFKTTLYTGTDLWRLSDCMLKRGRIYAADDPFGRHVEDLLRAEYRWLKRFRKIIPVPKVYPLFKYLGDTYMPVERIEGINFADWIKGFYKRGRWSDFSPSDQLVILAVFENATIVTGKVHAEGCVLCDITPDNFILPGECVPGSVLPVTVDWELPYDIANDDPSPHFIGGTPGYAPPEQMRGEVPTLKNDSYGLGSLLLHFVTGKDCKDFDTMDRKRLKQELKRREVNETLSQLVLQCRAYNPDERPTIKDIQAVIQQEKEKLIQLSIAA